MTHRSEEPRVEDLLREAAPRVLGDLVRRFGDFAQAEDAVQEAMIAAAERWPREGVPDSPAGWLTTVASRRMIDGIRGERSRRRREMRVATPQEAVTVDPEPDEPPADEDDTLVLMFMCCHPSLTPPSAIALTLRAVGGLTTGEIAAAFMVPEKTMGQRISRAKQAVAASGSGFELPSEAAVEERLASVLRVLYLIFNESYVTSGGPNLVRDELSSEAIRLARGLDGSLPRQPEVEGLLALMLLTEARRPARTDAGGGLVPLEEQDRSLWDRALIAEGVALVNAALDRGPAGPYLLQAAISAAHDQARTPEETDWPQILGLYTLLEASAPNPVVSLNRAIALAMVEGPRAGLERIEQIAPELPASSHRVPAARGHLLERAGDRERAIEQFERAAGLADNVPERDYLTLKASRLRAAG